MVALDDSPNLKYYLPLEGNVAIYTSLTPTPTLVAPCNVHPGSLITLSRFLRRRGLALVADCYDTLAKSPV